MQMETDIQMQIGVEQENMSIILTKHEWEKSIAAMKTLHQYATSISISKTQSESKIDNDLIVDSIITIDSNIFKFGNQLSDPSELPEQLQEFGSGVRVKYEFTQSKLQEAQSQPLSSNKSESKIDEDDTLKNKTANDAIEFKHGDDHDESDGISSLEDVDKSVMEFISLPV